MATDDFNDNLPIDSPERKRLPLLLRRAWYGLNQAFRRQISHAGATPDQFTVLRTLSEGDPDGLTQSELTRSMSSDPNTVASLLNRMAKRRINRINDMEILPLLIIVGKRKTKTNSNKDTVETEEQWEKRVTIQLENSQVENWKEIRKKALADKRTSRILLTSAGRKKYSELRDCAADLQGELLTTLPAERRDAFLEELAQVADACHAAAAEAGRKNRD